MKSRVSSFLVLILLLLFFPALAEENYVIAQPGDSGVDVQIVLAKCSELGFLKNLPANERNYIEKYSSGIKAMEKAMGFTADGIIRLDEFEEIETAIGPGSQGDTVKEVLEWLFDLGYITDDLPSKHNKYEDKFQQPLVTAETKLGLHADGFLTASELGKLKKEQLPELPSLKNVTAKYANGVVTISWNAVKGAVQYIVYRDGKEIATVTGNTSSTDNTIKMDHKYTYTVRAASYNARGKMSDGKAVTIPYVNKMTFSDHIEKRNKTKTDGKATSTPKELRFSTENDFTKGFAKVYSVTQQRLNNHYTRFTITLAAPAGCRLFIFDPPDGKKLAIGSNQTTSSNIEAVQFDIATSKLKSINYSITVNIQSNGNGSYWLFFDAEK